jgi:hypothetical protein
MSLYEGIPTGKNKPKKESWAPKHEAVFGKTPTDKHEAVWGKADAELSLKEAAERRTSAPIHDSVFKNENVENNPVVETPPIEEVSVASAAPEKAEGQEAGRVETVVSESAETTPPEEATLESTPEEKEAADLAAVRERLGINPEDTASNQPERTKEHADVSMWDDPAYKEIRDRIAARSPQKEPLLVDYQAEREYARAEPKKFAEHEFLERERIYRASDGAPDIAKDPTFNRLFVPKEYGGEGFLRNHDYSEVTARKVLILRFPEKAKAYAETDPMLRRMFNGEDVKKAA